MWLLLGNKQEEKDSIECFSNTVILEGSDVKKADLVLGEEIVIFEDKDQYTRSLLSYSDDKYRLERKREVYDKLAMLRAKYGEKDRADKTQNDLQKLSIDEELFDLMTLMDDPLPMIMLITRNLNPLQSEPKKTHVEPVIMTSSTSISSSASDKSDGDECDDEYLDVNRTIKRIRLSKPQVPFQPEHNQMIALDPEPHRPEQYDLPLDFAQPHSPSNAEPIQDHCPEVGFDSAENETYEMMNEEQILSADLEMGIDQCSVCRKNLLSCHPEHFSWHDRLSNAYSSFDYKDLSLHFTWLAVAHEKRGGHIAHARQAKKKAKWIKSCCRFWDSTTLLEIKEADEDKTFWNHVNYGNNGTHEAFTYLAEYLEQIANFVLSYKNNENGNGSDEFDNRLIKLTETENKADDDKYWKIPYKPGRLLSRKKAYIEAAKDTVVPFQYISCKLHHEYHRSLRRSQFNEQEDFLLRRRRRKWCRPVFWKKLSNSYKKFHNSLFNLFLYSTAPVYGLNQSWSSEESKQLRLDFDVMFIQNWATSLRIQREIFQLRNSKCRFVRLDTLVLLLMTLASDLSSASILLESIVPFYLQDKSLSSEVDDDKIKDAHQTAAAEEEEVNTRDNCNNTGGEDEDENTRNNYEEDNGDGYYEDDAASKDGDEGSCNENSGDEGGDQNDESQDGDDDDHSEEKEEIEDEENEQNEDEEQEEKSEDDDVRYRKHDVQTLISSYESKSPRITSLENSPSVAQFFKSNRNLKNASTQTSNKSILKPLKLKDKGTQTLPGPCTCICEVHAQINMVDFDESLKRTEYLNNPPLPPKPNLPRVKPVLLSKPRVPVQPGSPLGHPEDRRKEENKKNPDEDPEDNPTSEQNKGDEPIVESDSKKKPDEEPENIEMQLEQMTDDLEERNIFDEIPKEQQPESIVPEVEEEKEVNPKIPDDARRQAATELPNRENLKTSKQGPELRYEEIDLKQEANTGKGERDKYDAKPEEDIGELDKIVTKVKLLRPVLLRDLEAHFKSKKKELQEEHGPKKEKAIEPQLETKQQPSVIGKITETTKAVTRYEEMQKDEEDSVEQIAAASYTAERSQLKQDNRMEKDGQRNKIQKQIRSEDPHANISKPAHLQIQDRNVEEEKELDKASPAELDQGKVETDVQNPSGDRQVQNVPDKTSKPEPTHEQLVAGIDMFFSSSPTFKEGYVKKNPKKNPTGPNQSKEQKNQKKEGNPARDPSDDSKQNRETNDGKDAGAEKKIPSTPTPKWPNTKWGGKQKKACLIANTTKTEAEDKMPDEILETDVQVETNIGLDNSIKTEEQKQQKQVDDAVEAEDKMPDEILETDVQVETNIGLDNSIKIEEQKQQKQVDDAVEAEDKMPDEILETDVQVETNIDLDNSTKAEEQKQQKQVDDAVEAEDKMPDEILETDVQVETNIDLDISTKTEEQKQQKQVDDAVLAPSENVQQNLETKNVKDDFGDAKKKELSKPNPSQKKRNTKKQQSQKTAQKRQEKEDDLVPVPSEVLNRSRETIVEKDDVASEATTKEPLPSQPGGIEVSAQPSPIDVSAQPSAIEVSLQPSGIEVSAQPSGIEVRAQPTGIEVSAQPSGSGGQIVETNPKKVPDDEASNFLQIRAELLKRLDESNRSREERNGTVPSQPVGIGDGSLNSNRPEAADGVIEDVGNSSTHGAHPVEGMDDESEEDDDDTFEQFKLRREAVVEQPAEELEDRLQVDPVEEELNSSYMKLREQCENTQKVKEDIGTKARREVHEENKTKYSHMLLSDSSTIREWKRYIHDLTFSECIISKEKTFKEEFEMKNQKPYNITKCLLTKVLPPKMKNR